MVSLDQHGGEGDSAYKGKKSDMNLDQKGGEGGGKEGSIAKKSDIALLNGTTQGYVAPGRSLKVESGS